MNEDKIYYKYRSLSGNNWKYVLDILQNNRLYCARYDELNDPMEGFYRTRECLSQGIKDLIFSKKGNYRICSLAHEDENKLLWAHYADSFQGIVIGLQTKELVKPINYNGLRELNTLANRDNQDISSIFLNKHEEWAYENEGRIILQTQSKYLDIEIVEIIFGLRTDENLKKLMIAGLGNLNPNIVFKQQNRNFENHVLNIQNQIV
jgi:hypothetical protein